VDYLGEAGGGGVAAVSAKATATVTIREIPAPIRIEEAQAQIRVQTKIDDQSTCRPQLHSWSVIRNVPSNLRGLSWHVPFKVRLDDKRQVIWEGFYVEDRIPITMSLYHKGYISSKKAARRVLNALRESDMIEITVPFKESPDLVFRWSLEGAPEAIAQACPGR